MKMISYGVLKFTLKIDTIWFVMPNTANRLLKRHRHMPSDPCNQVSDTDIYIYSYDQVPPVPVKW